MIKIKTNQVTETGTVTELISTAEAKAHLRVDVSDDDTLIDNLITAARVHAEVYTGRSFATHTYRADIANFHDEMVLPHRPIQSITNIKYWSSDSPEVLTTLNSTIYSLYDASVIRDYGEDWPTSWAYRPDAVQITYQTGSLDNASPRAAFIPGPVRQAMLLLVGDLYENREMQTLYPGQLLENRAYDMLLYPYVVHQ